MDDEKTTKNKPFKVVDKPATYKKKIGKETTFARFIETEQTAKMCETADEVRERVDALVKQYSHSCLFIHDITKLYKLVKFPPEFIKVDTIRLMKAITQELSLRRLRALTDFSFSRITGYDQFVLDVSVARVKSRYLTYMKVTLIVRPFCQTLKTDDMAQENLLKLCTTTWRFVIDRAGEVSVQMPEKKIK